MVARVALGALKVLAGLVGWAVPVEQAVRAGRAAQVRICPCSTTSYTQSFDLIWYYH